VTCSGSPTNSAPTPPTAQHRDACAHYNALQLARGNYDYDQATPDSDPAFLERIAVNYLRHELSDYEPELAKLFGQVGRADASSVVRKRVYNAIADAYPDLASECSRQLRDRARYTQYV